MVPSLSRILRRVCLLEFYSRVCRRRHRRRLRCRRRRCRRVRGPPSLSSSSSSCSSSPSLSVVVVFVVVVIVVVVVGRRHHPRRRCRRVSERLKVSAKTYRGLVLLTYLLIDLRTDSSFWFGNFLTCTACVSARQTAPNRNTNIYKCTQAHEAKATPSPSQGQAKATQPTQHA